MSSVLAISVCVCGLWLVAQAAAEESLSGPTASSSSSKPIPPICRVLQTARTANHPSVEYAAASEPGAKEALPWQESEPGEMVVPGAFPWEPARSREPATATHVLSPVRGFEGLLPEQQKIFQVSLTRCGDGQWAMLSAALLFEKLELSERTTVADVTHALRYVTLSDSEGNDLGTALQLLKELFDIHGQKKSEPSEQQFQVFVRLVPGALEKLKRAIEFEEKGRNHIFHKRFPISFRQSRRKGVRGKEAGLHISVSEDGSAAVIHVDYDFGPAHLKPANSDIRAHDNYRKHIQRWPGLTKWWSDR